LSIPSDPRQLKRFALLAATLVAIGVLFYNVGSSLCRRQLPADAANRYFLDVSMAASFAATGDFPVAAYPAKLTQQPGAYEAFRQALVETTRAAGLHCWSVLGTVPPAALPDVRIIVKRADDPGRALLLGGAFKAVGVAPYLVFWLAPLAFSVVLAWMGWELAATGHGVAAGAFAMLLALSAYTADTLSLDYSAAGFYLTALLLVVPVTAYALRPLPQRTLPGVLGRAVLAGGLFAMSVLARSGALVIAPFLIVSLVLAMRGVLAARRPVQIYVDGIRLRPIRLLTLRPFWIAAVLVGATFLAPHAMARTYANHLVARTSLKYGLEAPPQAHGVWITIWEGLGDFDRTKSHFWLDARAQLVVGNRVLSNPESERILREAVLADIREDPLWFARILIRRLVATVLQRKLWPWAPVSGSSIAPASASNEGLIDNYYALTATADHFGLGPLRFEVPVPLLLLPWLFLILRAPILGLRGSPDALRSPTVLVALVAAAATVLPVAITTAGALEPQAFVLAYLLAAAFLSEALLQRVRERHLARIGTASRQV